MFVIFLEVHLLTMDRFVTVARVNPSGASSSKRKVPHDVWLEHYEIIENNGRNGRVQGKHGCKSSTNSEMGRSNRFFLGTFVKGVLMRPMMIVSFLFFPLPSFFFPLVQAISFLVQAISFRMHGGGKSRKYNPDR